MISTQVSHSRDTESVRGEAAALAADAEKLRKELTREQGASRQVVAGAEKLREQLSREQEASRQAAVDAEKLRGELRRAQAECRQLDAAAEKLRGELARSQEASRQLAASNCAEAVHLAAEIERLEREIAAARSAHGRAVNNGNKVCNSKPYFSNLEKSCRRTFPS